MPEQQHCCTSLTRVARLGGESSKPGHQSQHTQLKHLSATALQGWPKDVPFQFDVVAASALCERPDYEASGIAVGLCVAQHFAMTLQVSVGDN
jgi:hypothetical protein